MTRLDNWEFFFSQLLHSNRSRAFEWGDWDCGLFTADAIQSITGVDLGANFRGKYSTQAGAAQFGTSTTICEQIAVSNGLKEISPMFASRGDLLLVSNPPSEPAISILSLDGRAIFVTDKGLVYISRSRIVRAWKI